MEHTGRKGYGFKFNVCMPVRADQFFLSLGRCRPDW